MSRKKTLAVFYAPLAGAAANLVWWAVILVIGLEVWTRDESWKSAFDHIPAARAIIAGLCAAPSVVGLVLGVAWVISATNRRIREWVLFGLGTVLCADIIWACAKYF